MNGLDQVMADRNSITRSLLQDLHAHSARESSHADRVAVYSVATGERLGLTPEDLATLRHAAVLHDIGKLNVDEALLERLTPLDYADLLQIRVHATVAARILAEHAWHATLIPIVCHHHERWDGAGYPDGLSGDDIPLASRIIAVAEVWDAMTVPLPWREPYGNAAAASELSRCSGTQFDPNVVSAFLSIKDLIQPVLAF